MLKAFALVFLIVSSVEAKSDITKVVAYLDWGPPSASYAMVSSSEQTRTAQFKVSGEQNHSLLGTVSLRHFYDGNVFRTGYFAIRSLFPKNGTKTFRSVTALKNWVRNNLCDPSLYVMQKTFKVDAAEEQLNEGLFISLGDVVPEEVDYIKVYSTIYLDNRGGPTSISNFRKVDCH